MRLFQMLPVIGAYSIGALASESGQFEGEATPPAFFVDQGRITLKMKPDADGFGQSYFKYVLPNATTTWVQKFASQAKCNYAVTSGTFVSVAATGGSAGYREAEGGYGLGVNLGGKEGTGGCTQTNPTETLELDFRNGLAGKFIDYALLDLELKFTSTQLTIKLYKDYSTDSAPTHLVYTYTRTCDVSDCGPDSAGNDNRGVRVPLSPQTVAFNRMVISVAAVGGQQAAVTLEGGNDAGTSPSSFHVVSLGDPIVCNTPIQKDLGGGTSTTVVFFTPDGSPCPTDKTYLLRGHSREIEVLTGGSTTPISSIVTSVWAPQPVGLPGTPVPLTTVLPPILGELEVWCDGTVSDPVMPGLPGEHTWCRITQNTRIVGDGMMQVIETSLLEGDASRLR